MESTRELTARPRSEHAQVKTGRGGLRKFISDCWLIFCREVLRTVREPVWVFAGLTQPIFDGGRIQGNFDLTKAQQDELLQTYRKTVVSAFADVDNALVAVKQSTEKLRLQREVVTASRRAFQLAEQQLRAGTADIVTVLNTQLTLFQAEDSLSQAQLARLQAIVSLYQALGGGWGPTAAGTTDALYARR